MSRTDEQFVIQLLEGLATTNENENDASPEDSDAEPEEVIVELIDSVENLTEMKTLLCMLIGRGLVKISQSAVNDLIDMGDDSP